MSDRLERIRACLYQALQPVQLDVEDESHRHAGHEGARDGRGHFRVRIVAAEFSGMPLIKRHQRVYAALGDRMRADIHALSMTTLTPAQWAARGAEP